MSKQRTDTASEPIFVPPPFDTPPPIADHAAADNGKTTRKPQTPKRERKRRNFAKELTELQGRVDTAVKLYNRSRGMSNGDAAAELREMAFEALAGE